MKALVTYFSAEFGKTSQAARELAGMLGADIFEIVPDPPYSREDLNYRNPLARCNREHFSKKDVPVSGSVGSFDQYDTVYIGFPIWYGCAPDVVNSFCAGYDWDGKTVYIFATSGGSGIGRTAAMLQPFIGGARIADARRIDSAAELEDWVAAE